MILDEICANKRIEVEAAKQRVPFHDLEERIEQRRKPRDFRGAVVRLNAELLQGLIGEPQALRAVVDAQDFENRMLKAYIRDWPVEEQSGEKTAPD